ncbi:MAG: TIGR04283 family arsenosugar biosynthesis glycosyltransferase [Pikeienuella sp.]
MISVIIPTLNAAGCIGPCLIALGEAVVAERLADVVISDGGSSDEIEKIADSVGARLIDGPAGRGRQLAAGVATARGDWLLLLHADTVLAEGWLQAAERHIQQNPDRAGWFQLRFDDPSLMARLVAGWANLRARVFGLPYGDQGMLIHRDLYDQIGGMPGIPLMEDVALARKLGRRRLKPINAIATTTADKYRRDGWLRRGSSNLIRLARFLCGASPDDLAKGY